MTRARGPALAAALVALVACEDNEQRAARQGAAARSDVAAACASAPTPAADRDAEAPTADQAADAADAEHASCTRHLCEERCATQTVIAFHRACVTACTADGVCLSDSDCGQGQRCIAVAPVVRRCLRQPTSHPGASAPTS